jgi:DNA-binding winged helix-turn-helix (wHTH) protein
MASQPQSTARLAFGPFEVNVPAGQLLKSGVRIRLSGQPFQILLILLAHPGDVVTNEQLRERIWKEGTFVDFEHGLHAAVNKLRRALGDSAENPRYIETVPGRGYRFIGALGRQPVPISGSLSDLPLPPPAGGELSPARSKLGRRWWIAAAVTLPLGALGIWALSHLRQTPADERVLRLQINPPAGSEFTFGTQAAGISLSPDGKTAAYIATDHGKAALWVQPLDGATARVLAGTEEAGLPFWSPDSEAVAFFAHGKLQRVYLAGGAPQTICDMGQARGGSWSDNGRILFGGWNSGLFQVAASGGQPSSLTTLDAARGEVFHYWPQILPDGRFLYFVRSTKRENSGVYAASLAKPREPVRLLATDTNALYAPAADGAGNNRKGYLLWLRGGTLVAQDFDAVALKLSGIPHPVADPVARIGTPGQMQVSVSATGILLYNSSGPLRQFRWVDRSGKPRGTVVFRAGSLRGRALTLAPFGPPTAERFYFLPMPRSTYFARTPAEPARNNVSRDRRTLSLPWTGPATDASSCTTKKPSLATSGPCGFCPWRQVTRSRDPTGGRRSTKTWANSLPTPAGWPFSPTNPVGTRSTSTHFPIPAERYGFPRAEA